MANQTRCGFFNSWVVLRDTEVVGTNGLKS